MENFFSGFEKKAWGISIGPNKEMVQELDSLKDSIKEMQHSIGTSFDKSTKNTVEDVFHRMEKFRDPKKMIGMGLLLGGGLAGGALIGRAVTKSVASKVPIINKSEEFGRTPNPNNVADQGYGVNR